MKTQKSKVFARVLAIVLAVVMAAASSVTAFAAGLNANRADKAATVGKNWVDWVELLNDDACEALLDGADEWLKDLDLTYLASSGQKDATHTLPMEMAIDSSMNSLLKDDGYVHVYLGNQKNADGKYVTGGSTGTSNANDTTTTTAPGRNKVHIYLRAHASALVQIYRTVAVNGYADSIDGIIDILCQIYSNVLNNGDLSILGFNLLSIALGDQVGDLKNSLSLLSTINSTNYYTSSTETSKCGKSWRKKLGAKQTMKYIAQLLDSLVSRNSENNIVYNLIAGSLSLGALDDTLGIYTKKDSDKGIVKDTVAGNENSIIGGLLKGSKAPIWVSYYADGYLLYNGLAQWVMNHELPTTDGKAYYGDGATITLPSTGNLTSGKYNGATWNYDTVILDCISRNVLQKININVTYPEYVQNEKGEWVHDSAKARYERNAGPYEGDTNLKFSTNVEDDHAGNVYLFQYGDEKLELGVNDNLYDFAMRALKIAWKTVLKPTLHLLQINYNGHESDGKGTNFDNAFLKWYIENKATGEVRSFPATAYTDGSVEEWAEAVYAKYGAADAATFLEENVKGSFDYDEARKAKNDKYNWRDIEVTSLWNQVRYSPLADKYFNVRTGPANFYFLQTGTANIDAFMDAVAKGTKSYAGILEALNDFLIAALKDIFPDSANVGYNNAESGDYVDVALPTGFAEATTFNATTIMNNIYKVLEYVANCTNANLFNPYYAANDITYDGSTVNINANNIEEAIVPFAISALKQWSLTAPIHDSDWDKVSDLESGAVVALQEYLGYLFPDRDYSGLWKEVETPVGDTGKSYKLIKAKTSSLFDEAVMLMARDAVAYVVVATGTPVTKLDTNRTPWDPYTMSALNDTSTTIWDLANAVGCYFLAVNERFDTAGTNAKSKGFAALIGLGTGTIKSSNTIWANLDAIFNKVLPVSGQLQYNYSSNAYNGNAKFSSQTFIEDIIIADVKNFDLTNVVDGLGKIFKSAPIATTHVNKVLYYDILAPVVNSILGANSLNSGSTDLIPTADVSTPFNTFLLPANIRGSSYTNGIVPRLIKNLRLYFTGGASEYFYDAATFALMTFGFPGQLQQHEIGGVDIKVYDSDIYGTAASTTVKIKNNSYGINRFYHNQGDLDSSKQYEASRYWVKVNSAYVQNTSGSNVATLTSTATTIAPEKNVYYTPSWTATRGALYKVVVTYDILFDDTLTNGTATAASAASKTIASNQVATKWIYVPPTTYTQTWANQGSETFSGTDFKTKDGAYVGSVVTGTANNNIQIVAGSMYDVTASNVTSEGYGVRVTNNTTADITGKFYLAPTKGTAYNLRANDSATTVASDAAGYVMAYLAIDEEGNIYNKDGSVLGNYTDLKSNTWISGYHKTTNLDGEEIYDYILANAWNTPATVAFGAPGAGTMINDLTTLEKKEKSSDDAKATNIALFKSGSTLAAKYTVTMAFATSASARAVATPITIAYCGDMDGLRNAIDNYADVSACASAIQEGAKAACIRYRNSTNVEAWTNADKLLKAIQDAGEATALERGQQIADERFGENGLDYLDEVDYKIVGHREFRKYLEKYEKRLVAEPIVELDEDGEPVLDKDGNEIPVLDAKGRATYTYKAEMPQWMVNEFVRTLDLYKGYMQERAHDLTRINKEITHATSLCDDYDEVIEATANDIDDFSATATTATRHYVVLDDKGVPALDKDDLKVYEDGDVAEYRFAYSTKSNVEADNVKVYEVGTTATDVKFGAVEDGKLVNKGETKYTDDSWNAYIDALGEVITSIKANDPISKTYTATTHLVMAENELDPVDDVAGDNITVNGRVLIATDVTGKASSFGLRGVVVYAVDGEGNVIAQTESNAEGDKATWGDYTIEVPAGTTQLYVGSPTKDTIVNREFTIAGDADVTGADVAVVMCDYNDDGGIDVMDKAVFNAALKGDYNVYADFNNDGGIDVMDKGVFNAILKGGKINYSDLSF